MGMADAALECQIDGRFRHMDIVQFKEEPNRAEDAAAGEKLLIEEVVSINIPELKPYEYSTMYMQRNPPGVMPGCMTTMNGDPSFSGGVIRGTVLFYDAVECIKASMDFLLQDFGCNPENVDCKLAIYLSVLGIDLDEHDAFMDEDRRPGGSNPVRSKHPVMNNELGKGQVRLMITDNAFIYLQD